MIKRHTWSLVAEFNNSQRKGQVKRIILHVKDIKTMLASAIGTTTAEIELQPNGCFSALGQSGRYVVYLQSIIQDT